MSDAAPTHSAFVRHQLLASGGLQQVASAVFRTLAVDPDASVLVFSDETGRPVDLDLRGTEGEVAARHAQLAGVPTAPTTAPTTTTEPGVPRARGRPRLGVVSREVTLLPEHWAWLAAQPGGASVALRKLVLQAMRSSAGQDASRRARDRTYAFMAAIAGDFPGFEEATRALFAGDLERLATLIAGWPPDIRRHVARLLQPARGEPAQGQINSSFG